MKQVALFHLFKCLFLLETSQSASLNSLLTVPTKYYNDQNRYSYSGLSWVLSCEGSSLKVPKIPQENSLRPTGHSPGNFSS